MGCVTSTQSVDKLYHLQKVKLGEGSFGVVYRAVHRYSGEVVAIKQLAKAKLAQIGVGRKDTEREVRMMRSLSHHNVIRLHDVMEDSNHIYLALEYCDGGDFGDKVLERGEHMREPEAAYWVAQMVAAIAHLHARFICHRDIKPDNFLVAEKNRLKLADLGLATECLRGAVLLDKCGTPSFMAPEVLGLPSRSKGYGLAVDMWAAGVSMYMVLFAGLHPFVAERSRGSGGSLDERRLHRGELDFHHAVGSRRASLLGGFGKGPSSQARQLCQELVSPSVRGRLSAQRALLEPWIVQAPAKLERSSEPGPSWLAETPVEDGDLPRILGRGQVHRAVYKLAAPPAGLVENDLVHPSLRGHA